MFEENYRELANAIIMQAVKDFRSAYRRIKNHPDDGKAQETVREVTRFFASKNFSKLTTLDGPSLLRRVMREMDEKI